MSNTITTDPNYRTIRVKGDGVQYEAKAALGTIKPGMLVKLTNAAADTVTPHATARGIAARAFALENELAGKSKDVVYTCGSIVQYAIFRPGDVVNALIANGENIAKGDYLTSDGAGRLKKIAVIACGDIIAVAQAACDMSGTSGVDPDGFCPAQII